jgi:hypothetical protein
VCANDSKCICRVCNMTSDHRWKNAQCSNCKAKQKRPGTMMNDGSWPFPYMTRRCNACGANVDSFSLSCRECGVRFSSAQSECDDL